MIDPGMTSREQSTVMIVAGNPKPKEVRTEMIEISSVKMDRTSTKMARHLGDAQQHAPEPTHQLQGAMPSPVKGPVDTHLKGRKAQQGRFESGRGETWQEIQASKGRTYFSVLVQKL